MGLSASFGIWGATCSSGASECDPMRMLAANLVWAAVYGLIALVAFVRMNANATNGTLAERPLRWSFLVNVLLFAPLVALDNRRIVRIAKWASLALAVTVPLFLALIGVAALPLQVPPGYWASYAIFAVGFLCIPSMGPIAVLLGARKARPQ